MQFILAYVYFQKINIKPTYESVETADSITRTYHKSPGDLTHTMGGVHSMDNAQ